MKIETILPLAPYNISFRLDFNFNTNSIDAFKNDIIKKLKTYGIYTTPKNLLALKNSKMNDLLCPDGFNFFSFYHTLNIALNKDVFRLTYLNTDLLVKINPALLRVKKIFAERKQTFIICTDGTLYVCGYNELGWTVLGHNYARHTFTKVTIPDNKKVFNVFVGLNHAFIICTDETVYACGCNKNGQLGLGDTKNRNIFTKVTIPNNKKISNVDVGSNHAFIKCTDETVYACGSNILGQLGLGYTKYRNIFTKVTIPNNKKISNVVVGNHHTFIICTDGTVYACGDNQTGKLGVDHDEDVNKFTKVKIPDKKISNIITGLWHTFIICTDETVYACGYNKYGQLGLGDNRDRNKFTKVKIPDKKIYNIIVGGWHTFIICTDGTVYACGWNKAGQLGLGDTKNRNTFTLVPNIKFIFNRDQRLQDCEERFNYTVKTLGKTSIDTLF